MVKQKVVLTTGAFDILHLGHMMMLRDAKRLGGPRSKLVVVVASDKTVRRNKGRQVIFTASDRKKMVEFLKPVDEALIGYDPISFEKVLKKVNRTSSPSDTTSTKYARPSRSTVGRTT
jgi:FAD synthetase